MSRSAVLVAGSSNLAFSSELAKSLNMALFPATILRFPDGECRVFLEDEVVGKQVFVIQTFGNKPNDCLVETLLMIDALRRGGAKEIVLVCPYLAYSRQCVQDRQGVSVAARLFADFMKKAGVNHLVTMDLHAETVQGFFDFPCEHLTARKELLDQVRKVCSDETKKECVVVGPDLGGAKLSSAYAHAWQTDYALIEKHRIDAHKVESVSLLGDVKGKTVLLADDVCSTAGTLVSAANKCREKGAKKVYVAVTHGLFVDDAIKKIEESPIEKVFVSNTVEHASHVLSCPKICVISVVSPFAAAIARLEEQNNKK